MARPGGAVFGSLVGAGGVTAYNAYHSNDWGIMRTLQWWVEKGQADNARANNPELARLEDMIGRLTREMASRGREVHYMPSHSGAGYSTFYIVSGGVVVGIAYLRVWKGWSFSSMMPVTKEALKQGLSTIRSGVDGLSRKIQDVKDFVDERVEALSRKQDDLADSQEEMKDQLGDVQNNIQGMRGDIKTIEGDMKQFRDQQMYTNEGIFTLCSVLKEIMGGPGQKARGSRSMGLLDKFLNRTPKLPVHHNAGLESLLENFEEEPSENRGPLATRATPFRQRSASMQDEAQNLVPIARSRTQSDGLTGLRRSDSASSSFSLQGVWHRPAPTAQ